VSVPIRVARSRRAYSIARCAPRPFRVFAGAIAGIVARALARRVAGPVVGRGGLGQIVAALAVVPVVAHVANAQRMSGAAAQGESGVVVRPITRGDAIDATLASGSRVALARADSAAAGAGVVGAREWQNPTLNFQYTRDEPHYHTFLEVPIDYPWLRGPRIAGAERAAESAGYRYAYERAAARFDAETAYVRALAAVQHERLSRDNAIAADSLARLAVVRRDAGDASELDLSLATVAAGQAANAAASDSLAAIAAVLDLQDVMGLPADRVRVAPSDSLTLPTDAPAEDAPGAGVPGAGMPAAGMPAAGMPAAGMPAPGAAARDAAGDTVGDAAGGAMTLPVAAATSALASEESAYRAARHGAFAAPSLSLGVEAGDPTQPFPLPAAGLLLPLPLFNQNGGARALEAANVERARAQLALVRRESAAAIAAAARSRAAALARARRDRTMLDGAERVASLSVRAFAEGAQALPFVLESRRAARDALAQYIDDVAAAQVADAAVRLLTVTAAERTP